MLQATAGPGGDLPGGTPLARPAIGTEARGEPVLTVHQPQGLGHSPEGCRQLCQGSQQGLPVGLPDGRGRLRDGLPERSQESGASQSPWPRAGALRPGRRGRLGADCPGSRSAGKDPGATAAWEPTRSWRLGLVAEKAHGIPGRIGRSMASWSREAILSCNLGLPRAPPESGRQFWVPHPTSAPLQEGWGQSGESSGGQ